jgi:hypothetical protein
MITKFKTFLVAGALIASLPLISTANGGGSNAGGSDNAHDKVTLCHNGHSITISKSAVQKHLDNHNREGAKLTCFVVTAQKPCGSQTTPPPPPPPPTCGTCPTTPPPPCTGCQ